MDELLRDYWAAPVRSEAWRVDLLTSRDVTIRRLQCVTGGTLDWNAFREVQGGGTLEFTANPDDDGSDIDWASHRFRVVYVVEIGGRRVEVPSGVYLAAKVQPKRGKDTKGWSATLLDKTTVPHQELMPWPYSVPAKSTVTQYVGWILDAVGERRYAITPSSELTHTAMAWKAGTSRLRVINDLLASINYSPLYADGDGVLRADPYRDPASKEARWDFGGTDTVTSPEIQDDVDLHSVPNRIVLVGQESEDTPPMYGVAENIDDGPFSYNARGRWVAETEEGVDASSKETITAMAQRKLDAASLPVVRQTVQHPVLPLNVGDAAVSPDGKHMSVVEQSVTLSPGELATTVLRRFGV